MQIDTDEKKIDELLSRGIDEVIHKESLKKKLLSGKQLRVKFGVDPTSPQIHLGRSIPILKLQDFQKLGHQIVFIVGDFTGVIGDTSDKESERPMLSNEIIEENKKTYFDQVAKILDMERVEFRYNSEWLEKLTYREIGEHANQFSVADFIARDNIKRRLDAGTRVSLREMLYPLMQGYDSVAIEADVEIGGTDQRFNLLAGRTLQPHFKQEPQDILMTPLIQGIDGRKMSSSWGNTININDNPTDMYGKVMRVHDDLILNYFTLCTRVPTEHIPSVSDIADTPRDIKMKLAYEITQMYHGKEGADVGEKYFIETFQKRQTPDDIVEISPDYIPNLISKGIINSRLELKRLLDAGGVRDTETGEKLSNFPDLIESPKILKIGKRRFVKLIP